MWENDITCEPCVTVSDMIIFKAMIQNDLGFELQNSPGSDW